MDRAMNRRRFLEATAGSALVLSVASQPAAADPCGEYGSLATGLEDARTALEAELVERDELRDRRAALLEEVTSRWREVRGERTVSEEVYGRATRVADDARPGVAFLDMADESEFGERLMEATAWFVADDLLLTNAHNVAELTAGATRRAWTYGGESFEFEVVDYVEGLQPDVALLRTDHPTPAVLETGSSGSLSTGDHLVQVGHPAGFGFWVASLGVVTDAFDGEITSTVPGLTGVSGSPVLDLEGTVVGMTYGGTPRGEEGDGRPRPARPDAHVYPLVAEEYGLHVGIDTALELLEGWT